MVPPYFVLESGHAWGARMDPKEIGGVEEYTCFGWIVVSGMASNTTWGRGEWLGRQDTKSNECCFSEVVRADTKLSCRPGICCDTDPCAASVVVTLPGRRDTDCVELDLTTGQHVETVISKTNKPEAFPARGGVTTGKRTRTTAFPAGVLSAPIGIIVLIAICRR